MTEQPKLYIVPVILREAQKFVGEEHRHHPPPHAHKFSIGVEDVFGTLHGVAIAARPKARMLDAYAVLEVVRLATDGTPNACSVLYGAVARAGVAMGYRRHNIITYILGSEPGTSLMAAGWWRDVETAGGTWSRDGREREDKHPLESKVRWRACKPPGPEQVKRDQLEKVREMARMRRHA